MSLSEKFDKSFIDILVSPQGEAAVERWLNQDDNKVGEGSKCPNCDEDTSGCQCGYEDPTED